MENLRDAKGLTEAQAIARYQAKNYPKPALTADILVFTYFEETLHLLLIKRGGHPFMGRLALPGGFANENEPVEETAARELEEETGVSGLELELVGIFVRRADKSLELQRGGTVVSAKELAFDHGQILEQALQKAALI